MLRDPENLSEVKGSPEELEELGEADDEELAEVDAEADADADDEDVAEVDADEEAGDDTSLEELLAQRAARRSSEEAEESASILSFSTDRDEAAGDADPAPSKIAPIKDREEFVCKRCYLVKPKVQLANAERTLCRDCA